jgi:hypothetical protein
LTLDSTRCLPPLYSKPAINSDDSDDGDNNRDDGDDEDNKSVEQFKKIVTTL